MSEPQTVGQLGELGLLQRLFHYCPSDVVGDDAAVVALPEGQRLVVTTDVLVDGVHFSDRTTSPADVGWRAVAANLSDLAAMGADPIGITVGLSLPSRTPVAWVEGVYQGMAACLNAWGGHLIGGDLCRSDTISLAITALGSVAIDQVFYRRAAQPGQVLLATGYHGLSRAGLELLLNPDPGTHLPEAVTERWIAAHRRPTPRLDVVTQIRALLAEQISSNPTAASPIAAMDSSDGLANAVLHLCQASGVGATIYSANLPLDPALVDWVGPAQARDWCLYGGEDFELVLGLPEAIAISLQSQLGQGCCILGHITADPAVMLVMNEPGEASSETAQALSFSQGFQHF